MIGWLTAPLRRRRAAKAAARQARRDLYTRVQAIIDGGDQSVPAPAMERRVARAGRPARRRGRLSHRTTLLFASVLVAAATAAGVFAFFSAHGSGAATAAAGSLNAPTNVAATASATSGQVGIAWHQATLSDNTTLAQKYFVTRYTGPSGGPYTFDGYACATDPTASSYIDASAADGSGNFSCNDIGLTNTGPYSYTVTAIYHSWMRESAKSTPPVTVSLIGPLDHFLLSAASGSVTAGQPDDLTITAKDAANHTITSYSGDHSLTFSGASPIGTFNPTVTNSTGTAVAFGVAETVTFTNGVASPTAGVDGTMTLYTAETASVSVTDGSVSSNTVGVIVSAASATQLAFTQSPGNTSADNPLSPQPKVTIQDTYGNTVTTDSSTVALTIKTGTPTSGGAGSLGGCSQTESNGVVTFSGCKITTTGSGYQLHATDGTLTVADSSAFNITPGAATQIVFTQSPSNTSADNALSPQPKLTVQDQFGNTVTGDSSTVALSIAAGTPTSGGPGSVIGCSQTETNGVVSFSGCQITKVGVGYKLHATDGTLTPADSTAFNITPGAAAQLAFTQSPSDISADNALSPQPKVTVQDQFNNVVTSDSSTAVLAITSGTPTSGGPGAVINCSQNEVSGVITFSGCQITKVGVGYKLHATDGTLTPADSAAFNITPGAAAKVTITPSPASAAASATTNIQLSFQLQDQFSNNTTSSGTTTLGLSTSSANGIFAATNGASGAATANITFTSGVGTATEFYGDTKAATPTITAKNGTITWGTTSVTINAGAATKVTITPSPASAAASATTNIQLSFQLQDQFSNNTTSSGTTTLGLSTSSANGIFAATNGASGAATANITFTSGVGTATEFYGDTKAATPTITAKNGATTWGTTTVTITAGSATTISKTAGDVQSAPINNAFATALKVTVADSFNNPVSGVTVTFTAPTTGASGTFAGGVNTAITAADGTASAATFTANGTAGTYAVSVSAAGTNTPTFSLTNYGPWAWTANGTAQTWTTSTAKSVAYPAGTASGDLVLLGLTQPNNAAAPTITGWTQLTTVNKGNTIRLTVYWRAAGSETSASVTPPANSAAWVVDYKRTGGPAPALAGTATTGSGNNSLTIVGPAITTTGVNATVVSMVGIPAANTLSLSNAQSFTLRAALTSTSPSTAFGLADRSVSATGSVTAPTWAQTLGTGDWALVTGAFN